MQISICQADPVPVQDWVTDRVCKCVYKSETHDIKIEREKEREGER